MKEHNKIIAVLSKSISLGSILIEKEITKDAVFLHKPLVSLDRKLYEFFET